MSLFIDAAKEWQRLLDTSYKILLGHRNKQYEINLCFDKVDFYHLSGMHYAIDVDFKIRKSEYYGDKLLDVVLSKKIDDKAIEKSEKWQTIEGRLKGILNLRNLIDSEFQIYKYSSKKLSFHSSIEATYLIFNKELNVGFFLFIDKKSEFFYCKSIFIFDKNDYRTNQTSMTVLKKIRKIDNNSNILYTHPSYRERN